MSPRVALLGKPVAESLSPRMQNAAFAAAGLDWEYVALEVEPGHGEGGVLHPRRERLGHRFAQQRDSGTHP